MMVRIVVACCLFLGAGAGWAQTGAERINAFLEGVDSLRADFSQTLYDEELNRLEDASGDLFLLRPGRFRWDYVRPYEQAIVSDGETLWMYDSELLQVTVKTLDTAIENTPTMLLSSSASLEDHFDVSELPSQDDKVWVELRPKSSDATFSNIRVRFNAGELDSMELVDNFGQITHLEFKNIDKNLPLDEELFQFNPPEGVDVISDVSGTATP